MNTQKKSLKIPIITIIVAVLYILIFPITSYAEDAFNVVDLNSDAPRGAGFVSINDNFIAAKDNSTEYNLIMCGLKEGNKNAVKTALENNYVYYTTSVYSDDLSVKLVDNAFPDAEKYDANDTNGYDSQQCWAASVSNMLWMSGWAEHYNDVISQAPFSSEDDVFRLYNRKITDDGCNLIGSGIDWFLWVNFTIPHFQELHILRT